MFKYLLIREDSTTRSTSESSTNQIDSKELSSTYITFDQSNDGVTTHLPLLARSNNRKNKRELCVPHLLPMKVLRVHYTHHKSTLYLFTYKDNLKAPDRQFVARYLFYFFCLYFSKTDINPLTPDVHNKPLHTYTNLYLKAAGLFNYAWTFSGHQALKG